VPAWLGDKANYPGVRLGLRVAHGRNRIEIALVGDIHLLTGFAIGLFIRAGGGKIRLRSDARGRSGSAGHVRLAPSRRRGV